MSTSPSFILQSNQLILGGLIREKGDMDVARPILIAAGDAPISVDKTEPIGSNWYPKLYVILDIYIIWIPGYK